MRHLLSLKPGSQFFLIVLITTITATQFGCKTDSPTPPPALPNASFSYTSARVFPVQVNFVNTSTSPFPGPSTYIWDFGDGTTSTVINPLHIYITAGTYVVKLVQVYSNSTRDTVSVAIQLNANGPGGVSSKVGNIAATNFTFSIPAGYLVTFTNTSLNAISYLWDFGDAANSTSAATTVTHQYNAAGPFVVKLKATGAGGTDTCSATIGF
jgi:PKD repeat protein